MNKLPELGENLELEINTVINSQFVGLAGFIMNYDEEDNYSSLFSTYLGIGLSSDISYEDFITLANNELSLKQEEFLKLKEKVGSEEGKTLGMKHGYILKNFESIELFFKLLELYIPIEAEKILRFSEVDSEIDTSYINEVVELEEKIFGKEINKQPKYAHVALDEIKKHKETPAIPLTNEEELFLEKILGTVEKHIGTKAIVKDNTVDNLNISDPYGNNSKLNNPTLLKMLPRETYCMIFKLAFEILGMPEKKVIVKSGITNISVGYEGIFIPNNEDYSELSTEVIISLIAHELERHCITNENNLDLIGNMKSLSYLGKEEGLAHTMEFLAKGYDLNEIPINKYLPRMLVGEIVPGDDFKKFLHIMNKLDGETINVDDFFNRFKRGKSYKLAGVNPKEKLYGIGALETISRLININVKEDPRDLFLAKNGYNEQDEIKEISNKSEKDFVFPLLLGELIRYQIIADPNEDGPKGLETSGFMKFFWDKYGELFDNIGLSLKDILPNNILKNKNENKDKVNQIIELIKNA